MTTFRFKAPIDEAHVREPRVGDSVYISGLMITARDQAHRRALEYFRTGKPVPVSFRESVVFHCGPIAVNDGSQWKIVAAGPTTSTRMEPYEAEFIQTFRPRIFVGKAGMGSKTAEAAKRFGALYCDFTGGAAVLAAEKIRAVKGVEWYDLGMPEALWILEVEEFGPATVTINSHGNNLHEVVQRSAQERVPEILKALKVSQES
jgi:fumarate hydratase subunit beta